MMNTTAAMREGGRVNGPDTTRPNAARVYEYWLGGKDNFAADRELAEEILDPARGGYAGLRDLVRDSRAFTIRAVQYAARQGITQLIDIGCGLPTHPAVHEAARAVAPLARVAYVDNDPLVLSHVAAMQAKGEGLAAVDADLADPAAVLAHPALAGIIGLAQPVCVILAAVLHFRTPDEARRIAAGFTAPLAPGSCLVATCARYEDPALNERIRAMYATAGTWVNHSRADFASFFAGLEMVPPGVAAARGWRAGWGECPAPGEEAFVLGGIGLKP